MPSRQEPVTPFKSGQRSNEHEAPGKAELKFKMSKVRNIGQPDPLSEAISGRSGYIPSDLNSFSHSKTSKPRGVHYSPAGEFGKPSVGSIGKSKATNPMGGHGGSGNFRGKG